MEKVYNTLRGFFPKNHFIHSYRKDQPLRRVGIEKRLLLNPREPALVTALQEMSELILYAKHRQPTIYSELLRQVSVPVNLQATLYEAFIASRFERAGVTYRGGCVFEGKPRDGFFVLGGKEMVVECKAQFAPKRDEFDVLRRAMDEMLAQLYQCGIEGGFGFVLRIQRPALPSAIQEVRSLVSRALLKYAEQDYQFPNGEVTRLTTAELEVMPLGQLDPGEHTSESEFILRMEVNPDGLLPGSSPSAPVDVRVDFFYTQADMMAKLERTIKAARKQHRLTSDQRLIICVDSQELPDFNFGLFQNSSALSEEHVKARINQWAEDSVVVVTRREYKKDSVQLTPTAFGNQDYELLSPVFNRAFSATRKGPFRMTRSGLLLPR